MTPSGSAGVPSNPVDQQLLGEADARVGTAGFSDPLSRHGRSAGRHPLFRRD